MQLINKITLLFLFYFILICTNMALCSNIDLTAADDSTNRKIVFASDSTNFQIPNPILAIIGYKPTTNDTIAVEHAFDSSSIADPKGVFHIWIVDSNKIVIELDKNTKQKILPITFYNRGDTLGVKNIKIKMSRSYGNWLYIVIAIILIFALVMFVFWKKLKLFLLRLYNKYKGNLKSLFSKSDAREKPEDREDKIEIKRVAAMGDDSIKVIEENLSLIAQAIEKNNKSVINKIEELKLSEEKRTNYEIKINEKDNNIKKITHDLEGSQQKLNVIESKYQQFQKSVQEKIDSLNEAIKTVTQEKVDFQEKYKKLETDFQLYRSRQSEMSANSLQITAVDKKKMDRYKETCKSIIKMINEVPPIVLGQNFGNPKIMNLLNQTFLGQYLGNFGDLLKIRDDIENILLYQRTDNSLIRDKFPGALTVGFEEFDPKYREIIFDNCIYGKVDKMLIGFRMIYGIQYQLKMSAEDLSQFEKMCDRIKSLENELILNLKLGGFEPYPISLFEELNVQKASYIENIGGLSLKEKYPYFEKKPDQRDLILEITQWTYKKDGGLWKNRKALVKIST